MENKEKLIDLHRNQQEKYMYYIIALAVACLAFAVHTSIGLKLDNKMIPLGISIILWLVSVYSGLVFLKSLGTTTSRMIDLIESVEERNNNKIEEYTTMQFIRKVNRSDKKSDIYASIQAGTLYSGTISFIVWRILVMS